MKNGFIMTETRPGAINSRLSLVCITACARLFFFLLVTTSSAAVSAFAQVVPPTNAPLYGARTDTGPATTGLPPALRNVGIDQKLNQQLPLELIFRDDNGVPVKLGQYFGKKPVVLSLVYYNCPMLCTQVLNGMVTAFRVLPFKVGDEFDVVTVSFDPRESAALAAAKKKTYVNYLPNEAQSRAQIGWHFLTGDESSIKQLADAVGFRYHFDEATNQFAHASAIMVATPKGKLSHYFYGIEYSARDLRLALVESTENKIGSPVDQLLLYCYHYDPATGRYGAVVMNMIRLGGLLTIAGIGALLLILRRRGPRTMRLRTGGVV
jgi:protein SCO1